MPSSLVIAVQPGEPQSRLQRLRRGELLEAAVAVIGEEGLSRLTLARVAARAGLSAASVNFHFDSKDNLLRETLRAVVLEFHDAISAAIACHPDDPVAAIEAVIDVQFSPPILEHGKAVVWYAFTAETPLRGEYRELSVPRYERYRAQMAELFEQLSEAGRLSSRLDATMISTLFVGVMDSLCFDFMIDPAAFGPKRAIQVARSFLREIVTIDEPRRSR
jgi:TetR/AcrR family transcriptional repressor of bet genes